MKIVETTTGFTMNNIKNKSADVMYFLWNKFLLTFGKKNEDGTRVEMDACRFLFGAICWIALGLFATCFTYFFYTNLAFLTAQLNSAWLYSKFPTITTPIQPSYYLPAAFGSNPPSGFDALKYAISSFGNAIQPLVTISPFLLFYSLSKCIGSYSFKMPAGVYETFYSGNDKKYSNHEFGRFRAYFYGRFLVFATFNKTVEKAEISLNSLAVGIIFVLIDVLSYLLRYAVIMFLAILISTLLNEYMLFNIMPNVMADTLRVAWVYDEGVRKGISDPAQIKFLIQPVISGAFVWCAYIIAKKVCGLFKTRTFTIKQA